MKFQDSFGISKKFHGNSTESPEMSKKYPRISTKFLGISKNFPGNYKKCFENSKKLHGMSKTFPSENPLEKKTENFLWKIPYKKSYLVYPPLQISRNSENPCAKA